MTKKGHKGTFWGGGNVYVFLAVLLGGCVNSSKRIQLHIEDRYILLYANYISIKVIKKTTLRTGIKKQW